RNACLELSREFLVGESNSLARIRNLKGIGFSIWKRIRLQEWETCLNVPTSPLNPPLIFITVTLHYRVPVWTSTFTASILKSDPSTDCMFTVGRRVGGITATFWFSPPTRISFFTM